MHEDIHWGPGTPNPLSQMRTELVWEGTCLYSRFRSEMIGRDQGENEVRWLLVPPTNPHLRSRIKGENIGPKAANASITDAALTEHNELVR